MLLVACGPSEPNGAGDGVTSPAPSSCLPERWGTAFGGWGDLFAALGNVQAVARDTGEAYGLLYWSTEPGTEVWVRAHAGLPGVRVQQVPVSPAHWAPELVRGLNPELSPDKWLPSHLGIDPERVTVTHPDFRGGAADPIRRPVGLTVPLEDETWAKEVLGRIEGQVIVLFPWSTRTTPIAGHWGHWKSALATLLAQTSFHYVVCGEDVWELGEHPRLTNLTGATERFSQVMALIDRAAGFVGTSSAAAMWAVLRGKPALICCNERVKDGTFFHRWLQSPRSRVLEVDTPGSEFIPAFQEWAEVQGVRRPVRSGATIHRRAGALPASYSNGDSEGAPGEAAAYPGKVWCREELPYCIMVRTPAGIGDISWVYSKLRHMPSLQGRPVLVQVCGDQPRRSEPFIRLLPDFHWGGYAKEPSWPVIVHSAPAQWPSHLGMGPIFPFITGDPYINCSANLWMEQGRKLAEFFPLLPTDYHYPLSITAAERQRGQALVENLPGPLISVYTSNRDKDRVPDWDLWPEAEWAQALLGIRKYPGLKEVAFAVLGAEFDRDKAEPFAALLERGGAPVVRCIGESLGTALEVMRQSCYGFFFPSGMGVLANVVRLPAVMLLPWHLEGLREAYADPYDLSTQVYRCFVDARPEEVMTWWHRRGAGRAYNSFGNRWRLPGERGADGLV